MGAAYLVALLAYVVLASWWLFRRRPGRMIQYLLAWTVIFALAAAIAHVFGLSLA